MISSQQLVERIQKNVGVPCQSQRSSQRFELQPTLSSMYGTIPLQLQSQSPRKEQSGGLIQLPHEGGEEASMGECARWLRTFVTEVPIDFIPSGDPFWMQA